MHSKRGPSYVQGSRGRDRSLISGATGSSTGSGQRRIVFARSTEPRVLHRRSALSYTLIPTAQLAESESGARSPLRALESTARPLGRELWEARESAVDVGELWEARRAPAAAFGTSGELGETAGDLRERAKAPKIRLRFRNALGSPNSSPRGRKAALRSQNFASAVRSELPKARPNRRRLIRASASSRKSPAGTSSLGKLSRSRRGRP